MIYNWDRDYLLGLREQMRSIGDAIYVLPGEGYLRSVSPLHNHCGPVANAVWRLCGGVMLLATAEYDEEGVCTRMEHLWNRLPNGEEVDLTSDQFGGDGLHPTKQYEGKGIVANITPYGMRYANKFWKALQLRRGVTK
jgi:hypothetical protein